MRYLLAAACVAVAGSGAPVLAGDQPVVIELYTSQGCSSCPPADELLGKLAGRADVIALALHVDYWDYIGWKDIFGSPAFTVRQKGYAAAAHSRRLYTPQLIVDGQDHVVGYRPMEVADLIQKHRATPDPVALTATRSGDRIALRARVTGDNPGPMVVQLARFIPSETVLIERGENAGDTITYHNIVRDWAIVAKWDGKADLAIDMAVPEGAAAVIIQADGFGPVVAAARLR